MVQDPATKDVFALKSMVRAEIKAQNCEQSVMDEKELMAKADTPFVVQLINTYKSSKRLYMLMEVVQGGELYSRVHPRGKVHGLENGTARFYAGCVAVGLSYLHSLDILSRDLKPENVLIDSTGYAKICDMGFSKVVPIGSKTYTLCGTVEYLAPELLVGRGHNRGVDWWAFGVLIYEMIAGLTPFEDPQRKEGKVVLSPLC